MCIPQKQYKREKRFFNRKNMLSENQQAQERIFEENTRRLSGISHRTFFAGFQSLKDTGQQRAIAPVCRHRSRFPPDG